MNKAYELTLYSNGTSLNEALGTAPSNAEGFFTSSVYQGFRQTKEAEVRRMVGVHERLNNVVQAVNNVCEGLKNLAVGLTHRR